MSDPVNIDIERARRADDNRKWTPADCLRILLEDLESGKVEATSLLVVVLDADDKGKYDVRTRACNLLPTDVISMVEVVKAGHLARLLGLARL